MIQKPKLVWMLLLIFLYAFAAAGISFAQVTYETGLDELAEIATNAPLSSFKHRNGAKPTEFDRQDILTEIDWERERYAENPNAVLNILSWTFKSGKSYPGCRRKTGLDVDCMDTNRWMVIKNDLQKSKGFARLANEMLKKENGSKTVDKHEFYPAPQPPSAPVTQAPTFWLPVSMDVGAYFRLILLSFLIAGGLAVAAVLLMKAKPETSVTASGGAEGAAIVAQPVDDMSPVPTAWVWSQFKGEFPQCESEPNTVVITAAASKPSSAMQEAVHEVDETHHATTVERPQAAEAVDLPASKEHPTEHPKGDASTSPSANVNLALVERLTRLRDAGALTDAEFEAERNKIING